MIQIIVLCVFISIVYLDLCVEFGVPTNVFTHLVYFIKNQSVRIVEKEQFIR